MKIVIVKTHFASQGGIEKYTKQIGAAFAAPELGHQVTLLTESPPVSNLAASIQIAHLPKSKGPQFWRLEQFDRHVQNWLTKEAADIVFGMDRTRKQTHYRAGNGVHAAYLQSRLASDGIFKYALCQINPLHRKILKIEKETFEYPGLRTLFVNSHMVKQEVLTHYAVDPAKIEVIHNGVEWQEKEKDFANWPEKKEELLKTWKLPIGPLQLLFIGNGYQRKGLNVLLEALANFRHQSFHLSIVGKDKNIAWYQKKAVSLGLAQHVRFFGPQENTTPFYQLADCLVIPSFYDPFANVTLEALAMGLFVISSKSNGGSEILTSENGTLIDDLRSTQSILAALSRAFYKTKESAIQIRSSIAHLDFAKQLQKLIKICV